MSCQMLDLVMVFQISADFVKLLVCIPVLMVVVVAVAAMLVATVVVTRNDPVKST